MKIGLFYGTTSAATQEVADLIQEQMSDCEIEVFDVYEQDLNKMSEFDIDFSKFSSSQSTNICNFSFMSG